jgi:eukaryotic-like serine/threonine-protein kinase
MPTWNPRANDLFSKALELLSADERREYVEAACAGDEPLRAEVEALLEASARAGSFLESPAAGLPSPVDAEGPGGRGGATVDVPARETPGTVIGPYKLLQQIGEGGMGTVYMAEQTHPVHRKVALKVIKPGMDSRQVIARFEAERQALAMMDHVNIARVLDAGTTESGLPYFVMELIHGIPITRYCDDNKLTPRERLELFVPVCQAIQHAHQKGIIHRDIKPSNVMVTLYDGKPVPKVIDFGVAKATEQKLTERTLFTQYGTMVGTLEYMSPEQAEMSALGIDTRSDIYSLGVLLYELLTGSTPLSHKRVREAAYGEILRIIKEEEPQKPSTRLSDSGEALASISAQRHMEPAKLSKLMRGELDWIVMKTLEKDRNRRYESANGFAADVQRYLNDEHVLACPASAGYRLRKFVRRNKRALATMTLLGGMLLLGVVLLVVNNVQIKEEQQRTDAQKDRAETALGEAKENLELADENLGLALESLDEVYMKEIEKRVLQKRQLTPADREFLQKGLRFYEQFGKRNSTHVGLQGATAKANRRAGYLRLELSQWQEAVGHFRKAIPLLEKLAAGSPTAAEFLHELASTQHGLSVVLANTGLLREAETTCRQAIALWRQLAAEFPTVREYRVQLGHSLWQLRVILSMAGSHPEAEKAVREALKLYEGLTVEFPEEQFYRQETALSRRHLADSLKARGRLPEAVENYQQSVVLYAGLVADSPDNVFFRYELAYTNAFLGHALKDSRRTQEAEDAYRQAVNLHEKLVQDTPKVANYRKRLAWYQGDLAYLLVETKRFPEAELCSRRALDLYKELVAEDRAEPDYWYRMGGQSHALAQIIQAAGRPGEVKQAYEQAVQALREAVPLYQKRAADSPTSGNRWQLADCQSWLGVALRQAGHPEEAIKVLREAASIWEKLVSESNLPDHGWQLAVKHDQLGNLLKELGRHQEAERAYRSALVVWKKLIADYNRPEDRSSLAMTQAHLAHVLMQQGKHSEAAEVAIDLDNPELQNHIAWQIVSNSAPNPRAVKLAVGLARKAVARTPDATLIWNTLWVAHYRDENWKEAVTALLKAQGKLDAAIARHSKAIELDPKSASAHNGLGNALIGQKKLDEAIACYRRAIELDPKSASAHNGLGCALFGQKKLDEAIACYRRAIELDPKSAKAHSNLGLALSAQKKLDQAIVCYRKAIELDQKFAHAHAGLGYALSAQGKLDEAIACHREAIRLEPDNAVWRNAFGCALSKHGKLDEAIAEYRQAIKRKPDFAVPHYNLGLALKGQGKVDQAIVAFERVIELEPTHALRLNQLAWLLATFPEAKFRNPKRAVELAKRALDVLPKEGNYWNTLGAAHYRAGNWKDAVAALENSCKLQAGGTGDCGQWIVMSLAHGKLANEKELPEQERDWHKTEARRWYDQATKQISSEAVEGDPVAQAIRAFRVEAAELLGVEVKQK